MTAAALDVRRSAAGDEIVRLAREWIGTPYEHQASCRGAGADCLGLIRGVWRELHGAEPEAVPSYSPDWTDVAPVEVLLEAASRHLCFVDPGDPRVGDVILLRMRQRGPAKHTGLLALADGGHATLIHAYSGRGVVESVLTPPWIRRVAGTFRYPDGRN